MKYILFITIITIFLNSCIDTIGDSVDQCGEQVEELNYKRKGCDLKGFGDMFQYCFEPYHISTSETHKTCKENIRALSCEEVGEMTSFKDLETVVGCLNFPNKLKKNVCIESQTSYCRSLFNKCGKTALYDACKSPKFHESEDGTRVSFSNSEIKSYCNATTNGDEEVSGSDDLFGSRCNTYEIDCNNIQELDFRNDSWKSICGSK